MKDTLNYGHTRATPICAHPQNQNKKASRIKAESTSNLPRAVVSKQSSAEHLPFVVPLMSSLYLFPPKAISVRLCSATWLFEEGYRVQVSPSCSFYDCVLKNSGADLGRWSPTAAPAPPARTRTNASALPDPAPHQRLRICTRAVPSAGHRCSHHQQSLYANRHPRVFTRNILQA